MKRALLLQLPVPGFRWPHLDANIPLAAGYLASHARSHLPGWDLEILPWQEVDLLGTPALVQSVLSRRPDLVGLSVYLWNVEHSLSVARQLADAGIPVIMGGPEVSSDNHWLLAESRASDTRLIGGEGEQAFARLIASHPHLPPPGPIIEGSTVDLGTLESPYLGGLLGPAADGSIWLESVRGCPLRCHYCNYGKRHRGVRPFREEWLADHLSWARGQGVREVYLMDPSFNVRTDWQEVLHVLAATNPDRQLHYHTELVAEALEIGDAARLAAAGLASCEVGLQSAHPEVLAAVGRSWHRERWLRGVRDLVDAGVATVVGLIAGLPGDSPNRFHQTLEFVQTQVPGAELQIFPLALLPGTELRLRRTALGLEALEMPPYTVTATPTFPAEGLRASFDQFERATGLELDPLGAVPLWGRWEGGEDSPYLSGARLAACESPSPRIVDRILARAAANFTLWIDGWSDTVFQWVEKLHRGLPHGILTLVLDDGAGWPVERLRLLQRVGGGGRHYLDRYLSHLYGPDSRSLPRIAVLVEDRHPRATEVWVARIRTEAELVWAIQPGSGWQQRCRELARDGETALVTGIASASQLAQLGKQLGRDAAGIIFHDEQTQWRWLDTQGSEGHRVAAQQVVIP